jgi:catechol 2,3-dioxygenase-like lactoylglutathione lyase family enzyme
LRATGFNHVSVHADSLDESVRFYRELFGMEPIPTPTFGFPVQWLRLGDQQLHLFVRSGTTAPQFHHIGLDVDDFEAVYTRARASRIGDSTAFFSHIHELPDGSVQMYIRDPAGNLIEVDWPDVRTLDRTVVTDIVKLSDRVEQTPEALRATLYLRG